MSLCVCVCVFCSLPILMHTYVWGFLCVCVWGVCHIYGSCADVNLILLHAVSHILCCSCIIITVLVSAIKFFCLGAG